MIPRPTFISNEKNVAPGADIWNSVEILRSKEDNNHPMIDVWFLIYFDLLFERQRCFIFGY